MSDLAPVLMSVEFWFGVSAGLALEETVRAGLRRRLGGTAEDENA